MPSQVFLAYGVTGAPIYPYQIDRSLLLIFILANIDMGKFGIISTISVFVLVYIFVCKLD